MLSDFTFLDDGNSDNLEDDLINWMKVRMMAREIKKVQDCLSKPYGERTEICTH